MDDLSLAEIIWRLARATLLGGVILMTNSLKFANFLNQGSWENHCKPYSWFLVVTCYMTWKKAFVKRQPLCDSSFFKA